MNFNTLQQLFGRGIVPGAAGAAAVQKEVGSTTPRIPRSAAPVPVGRPSNPLNPIVGPRGTSPVPTPLNLKNVIKKGLPGLAVEGALMLGDRLIPGGIPSEIRGAVEGGVVGGAFFGAPGVTLGVLSGADLTNERGKDEGIGTITGELNRAKESGIDISIPTWRGREMPGDLQPGEPTTARFPRPLQAAKDELPALTPQQTRAYQSEASRLQQQAAADPYFQQNELYRKAREAANKSGLPEDREKVEQLGLAIHAAKFGDPNLRNTPNPLMEGLQRQPAPLPREQAARNEAMDMAAAAVNQMLNPEASAAPGDLTNAVYGNMSGAQAPRFNTSATVDLSSMRERISDAQPNLNTFVANPSGEQGFAFDKNILDAKKRAAFMKQFGL